MVADGMEKKEYKEYKENKEDKEFFLVILVLFVFLVFLSLATIPTMSFTVRPVREERKSSGRTKKYLLIAATLLQSIFHLYQWKKEHDVKEAKETRRIRTLKRTVAILLGVLVALLLIIGTLKILVRLKAISLTGMISMVSENPPTDEHGFTNVLLLGVGDADHDGIDLTDTIMVASLDPDHTKSAILLSIPRDTYVLSTEKMGKGRINELYRDYKISLIRHGMEKSAASVESLRQLGSEVGTLIGLPIQGIIKVNFSGFIQAIDAIGGIDVFVPEDLIDTEYPGPNYTYETFTILKGPQHLSGATALKYVRSRHSSSDFSRSARQQQVIAAAAAKVRANGLLKNMSKITEILSIISKNVETTFPTRELLGLANLGKQIDQKKIISMQLSDQNGLFGGAVGQAGFLYSPPRDQFEGASVLLPVSYPEMPVTWKQIQAFAGLLFLNRELFVRPPSIAVLNAGAKEGSARKLAGELYKYGFNVIDSHNYLKNKNPSFETSFIAINPSVSAPASATPETSDRETRTQLSARMLQKTLQMKSPSIPVDPLAFAEKTPDIIIVLGKDYRFNLLQDLTSQ
jgi:LCP family protein required for cell wall assembly